MHVRRQPIPPKQNRLFLYIKAEHRPSWDDATVRPNLPGQWLQCQANGSNVCRALRLADYTQVDMRGPWYESVNFAAETSLVAPSW